MIRQLSRDELLEKVLTSIEDAGWSYAMESGQTSLPFRITITDGTESQELIVYIWNVGTGGKTRSEDEYRIQLKGGSPLRTSSGVKTLLLGWFEKDGVFVGFDAFKHKDFTGYSPSVQVPKHKVEEAKKRGVSFHTKTLKRVEGKEVVVCFTPPFIMEYINDLYPEYHAPSAEGIDPNEADVIEENPFDVKIPDSAFGSVSERRKRAMVRMNVKIREASFQRYIKTLYRGKCAICRIQADVTDAAHIIPVKGVGTDELVNGVQLCKNHHKAYDNGLLGIGPDYTILLNQRKADSLRRSGRDSELTDFIRRSRIGEKIDLPSDVRANPKPEYLAENCRLKRIEATLG